MKRAREELSVASKQPGKSSQFILQWHLTAKCEQKCRHCYMRDEPSYESELSNELSYKDCLEILDDFIETINVWKARPLLNFTGGDPLLKPEIFDLIKEPPCPLNVSKS